jgi:hypothetical protein
MKKLLLILLSTVITSLQAQTFRELSGDLSSEHAIYLENQVAVIFTETPILTNNLPPFSLLVTDDMLTFCNYKLPFIRTE